MLRIEYVEIQQLMTKFFSGSFFNQGYAFCLSSILEMQGFTKMVFNSIEATGAYWQFGIIGKLAGGAIPFFWILLFYLLLYYAHVMETGKVMEMQFVSSVASLLLLIEEG